MSEAAQKWLATAKILADHRNLFVELLKPGVVSARRRTSLVAAAQACGDALHGLESLIDELRIARRDLAYLEGELYRRTEETCEAQALIRLAVAEHPPADACAIPECTLCGYRDCPSHELLHYHHDGCPACDASVSRETIPTLPDPS